MNDQHKYQSLQIYTIIQFPQAHPMKFLENFADLLCALENNKALLIIFVDPSLLAPSQSMIKYFNLNPIAIELEPYIYAYRGTQIKMFEFFNVLNYPQVTVVKDKPNNILYNFIGCNQQKAWEALGVLATTLNLGKPHRKLNAQKKVCVKNHELKLINEVTDTSYRNGMFLCDGCQMLSHVQLDKPILHCSICQFDLCNNCSYNQSMN